MFTYVIQINKEHKTHVIDVLNSIQDTVHLYDMSPVGYINWTTNSENTSYLDHLKTSGYIIDWALDNIPFTCF